MSDDKTPSADSFADRIGRVLPNIFVIGLLFHLVITRQQQRIAQLGQRLSKLTDVTHPPR